MLLERPWTRSFQITFASILKDGPE